jgi:hypothetical protein
MGLMVIPVETGIQDFLYLMDSHFRGNDKEITFFKGLSISFHY